MKNKSFWRTLLTVVLAAIVAAAVCYLIYYYRESLKAAVSLVKEKGKKLVNSCCGEFNDYVDV